MPPPPHTLSLSTHHSSPSTHFRRGSLTTVITTTQKSQRLPLNTSPFSKYDKKWRWWHYLSIVILSIGLLESFALTLGYHFLQGQPSPIRIAVRQYPSLPYQHFNTSALSTKSLLQKGTTVYHVTKEFGPATMGGMGSVVTSLVAAQQRSGNTEVAVVMPYYSFLKNKFDIDRVVDLVIDLRDKQGKLVPIEFRVWKMMHVFNPPPPQANITTYAMIDGVNTTIITPPPPVIIPHTERVPVYLIGPGNRSPFSQAFRCRNPLHIYSSPAGLPQEWRDQYFAKAASQFLTHQATAIDEESLFAPLLRSAPHVDVIHLHGATNAYIAKFLDDRRINNELGPTPPSIVYTMHDYLDELQYTNTVGNVKKFLDVSDIALKDTSYVYGDRMFMSSLGIDRADIVTFVSRTMASAIVEGTLDFYLKELVMDHLLLKAQQRRFFGISNGLDFSTIHPFTNDKLMTRKLNYPEFAWKLLDEQQTTTTTTTKRVWQMSAVSSDFVATAKDKSKRFLVRRKLLSEEEAKRPLVLYIGRFQYNKGLEWFEQATEHFVANNMTFIILGQENNYPFSKLESLAAKYPEHVHILSTPKQHRQWSIFCRAAADFVFVPSQTESFGLVAAEGLMFGASVISTGVGGLQEFLHDRPETKMMEEENVPMYPQPRDIRLVRDKKTKVPTVTSGERYNAYLFHDSEGLGKAIRDCNLDYRRLMASKALREEYNLRMISSAMALGWDRQGKGPMHEYQHVYALALHHRSLPELSRHEMEEEQSLLRRLYQAETSL
ncbi:uncharacterized protein BX664DRAFT_304111 [Halteromyces radiatus]|uniref:uncharacterized protein n=1 Tax=Halteromyces radiatus TaxID=101107 RepID=UPI0022212412|nr:uncharacterized protein BX664DRAFT_304111 [Halteromyces radiatus]KAI8077854.1 hypothetical protein BX664DRAFT_304111 [Halteromyces radiatus]